MNNFITPDPTEANETNSAHTFIPTEYMNEDVCNSTIRLRSFKEGELIIQCNQIIRIEAAKAYSYFFLSNGKKVLSSRNLNYHVKVLDGRFFLRPHKSHIVNILHVSKILSTNPRKIQMSDGSVIEYSRRKAEEVEKRLANLQASKN